MLNPIALPGIESSLFPFHTRLKLPPRTCVQSGVLMVYDGARMHSQEGAIDCFISFFFLYNPTCLIVYFL